MVYYLSPFLSEFCFSTKYPLRSAKAFKITPISTRTQSFNKTFFPYCINEWNNLKADIRNVKSISIFKKLILSKKDGNSLFSGYDPLGEKLLTRHQI